MGIALFGNSHFKNASAFLLRDAISDGGFFRATHSHNPAHY